MNTSDLYPRRNINKRKQSSPRAPDPYKSQNSTTAPIYNRTSTPRGVVVKKLLLGSNGRILAVSNSSLQTYHSISEACRHTGISRHAITNICHAGGGRVGECHFRFENEGEEEHRDSILYNNSNTNTNTNTIQPAKNKLDRFDVSTLLPLIRKPPSSKSYKIELICKGTGDFLACFHSTEYAAQSLATTRKAVRQACRAFGNPDETHDFATCDLRYVETSLAYEYGAHACDFCIYRETHQERLERWKKVQLQEVSTSMMTYPKPVVALADEPELAELEPSPGMTPAASPKPSPKPSPSPASKKAKTPPTGITSTSTATSTSPTKQRKGRKKKKAPTPDAQQEPQQQQEQRRQEVESTTMDFLSGAVVFEQGRMPKEQCVCVGCQHDYSAVVFEPCHHKVLCQDCATKYCPNFCPKCYAPIQDRLLPDSTIHVQPRVYSAYSFF